MSTLVLNQHRPVDATAGTVAMTLPTGASEGTEVSCEKFDTSTNTVTITGNITGVPATTHTLSLRNESVTFRADSSGSWWPVADRKSLTSLDDRFDRVNNVMTFGAIEDGTAGSPTDNSAAITAAINAAKVNGLPVFFPWSTGRGYGISSRINWPDSVDKIGQNFSLTSPGAGRYNSARVVCLTATAGVSIGNTLAGGNNSSASSAFYGDLTGRLIIDGNNVATQPLLFGRRTQSTIGKFTVINAAAVANYSAGTTYTAGQRAVFQGFCFQNLLGSTGTAPVMSGTPAAPTTTATWALVADNAAVVVQEAQNTIFDNLFINNCAGAGLLLDGGCGGNQFRDIEITSVGGSSFAVVFQTSYNSGAGSASPVYATPSRNIFFGGNIERIPASALGMVGHASGTDNTFISMGWSSNLKTSTYSTIQMMFDGTNVSTRLRFRDCFWFSETSFATVYEVANGCDLIHSGDVGVAAQYVYYAHTGAFIDASSPYPDWTGVATLLNPSSIAIDGVVDERHNVGMRGLSGTSRASGILWEINSSGTGILANLRISQGNLGGGSGGLLAIANTGTMPTTTPTSSCVMGSINGAFIAHTSGTNSIDLVAGNWQVKSANYTMVTGDKGVLATATSANLTITLPLATTVAGASNVVGLGTELVIRRTDNSANTFTVAVQGSDVINILGTLSGVTTTTIAALQVIKLVSDGTGHWIQI